MKRKILIFLLFVSIVIPCKSQKTKYKPGVKVQCPVCYASGKVEKSRIPPPSEFLLKSAGSFKSEIIVEYIGFSEEAQNAFQYAVDIWQSLIESDMPIRMEAIWSGKLDDNVLGSCGPETYYSNFKDAPFEDRYYPVAIAEKIAKEELNGESRYDMNARFNKKIDWYLGTDLYCPDDKYNFVSVVLHEIGHGLGFTGFFFVEEDLGSYGFYEMGDATSFDLLVQSSAGKNLVNTNFFDNVSVKLEQALTSITMYSNSPVAKSRNGGVKPRLYSPSEFDAGSSVYHLNDASYPHGNINSLMTHAVGKGEVIHDPGPLTLGIMDDIGWRNLFIRFYPPKDKEYVSPIEFEVSIDSDYKIDTKSLVVIYSNDGFTSHSDTLSFNASGQGSYITSLNPEAEIDSITYYIQIADYLNRVRTSPSLAPEKLHTVKFGPDNTAPVIEHEPIPYFLNLGEPVSITVEADDNTGIDSVYISFLVNDVLQTNFNLTKVDNGVYTGVFPLNVETLADGDSVKYTIFARDSSAAQNSTKLPLGDKPFSFKVEEIYDPVHTYSTDFDNEPSEFLLRDFDIYLEDNFENKALHSLHPYLSPGSDNQELNFWTFLKRPIILNESATMSYDEVVLVEPGVPGSDYGDDDFWDYVIVEASKNYGESWWSISEGYDSGDYPDWKSNYNNDIDDKVSQAEGTATWFYNREIDMLENGHFVAGDTVLIRFRIYSDPYATGWGWVIDNLVIQQPVSVNYTGLSSTNVKVFPNPFNNSVMVYIGSIKQSSNIEINVFDMFGKKVHYEQATDVVGKYEENIQLNSLGAGMYLLNVTENGKQLMSKKLIKN